MSAQPVEMKLVNQARVSDVIYGAGIEAAGQLDKSAPVERSAAAQVLVAALERQGLRVQALADVGGGVVPHLVSIGEGDGIVVSVEGDESPLEMGGLLRRHHWQRMHLFTFGRQGLGIKTISA